MVKNRLNSYAKYAFLNAYPLNGDPTKTIFYYLGVAYFSKLEITYPIISITYLRMCWIKGLFMFLYDDDGDGNMRHYL